MAEQQQPPEHPRRVPVRDRLDPKYHALFDKCLAIVELHANYIYEDDAEARVNMKLAIVKAIKERSIHHIVEQFNNMDLVDCDSPHWEEHEHVEEKCLAILRIDLEAVLGAHCRGQD